MIVENHTVGLTESIDNTPSAQGNAEDADVRLQRIAEYLDRSLAKEDALEANLGAVNGDLLLMEYRFRQALGEVLDQSPSGFDDLEAAMPAVNDYLRLVKQIDRFSQLALKLAERNSQD